MKWTREDFCRGWLITGATGCGKTASIMMRILFGLCTHVPDWGGMALDDKGLFYRILVKMFRAFGREKHLRLIQVRLSLIHIFKLRLQRLLFLQKSDDMFKLLYGESR